MIFKYKGQDISDVMLECDAMSADPYAAVIEAEFPEGREPEGFTLRDFVTENLAVLTLLCGEAHRQWLEADKEDLPGENAPAAPPSVQ